MIAFPRSLARLCRAVFRKVLNGRRRPLPHVFLTAGPDGVYLCFAVDEVILQYHHAGSCTPATLTVPLDALADCEGADEAPAEFRPASRGRVELQWRHKGVPQTRIYDAPSAKAPTIPAWPSQRSQNDHELLTALAQAVETTSKDAVRYALTCVQLRGKTGEVIATDGRQLLIHRGHCFPWTDDVLIPRCTVFSAAELPHDEPITVARTDQHVLVGIGPWTVALTVQSGRFPDVHQVIPSQPQTVWRIPAAVRAELLQKIQHLPGGDETDAPVTVALADAAVVRARGEHDRHATEVSACDTIVRGPAVQLVTNRAFLARALRLGFEEIGVTAADKPVVCQDDRRIYVWMTLSGSEAVSAPTARRRMSSAGEPVRANGSGVHSGASCYRPVPSVNAHPQGSSSQTPGARGWLQRLLVSMRGLGALVREQRRRERERWW